MRLFKHKYKSGKVIIKSSIPLETAEITFILDTINEFMGQGYYEPCYNISKKICHQFSSRINWVETRYNSRKFWVNILK